MPRKRGSPLRGIINNAFGHNGVPSIVSSGEIRDLLAEKHNTLRKGMVIIMAEVTIDEFIDTMDELLDKAQSFPLSSKKSLVDVEQLRECLDHIRMNLPTEVKQAKKIVSERKSIIDEANRQAEEIVTRAEARKNALIAEHEITRAAQAKAAEIEKQALIKAKAIKNATDEYIVSTLSKAEETLAASLTAVKRTKGTIKSPSVPNVSMQNNNIPQQR